MPEQVKKTIVLSIYFALAVSALLVFWQVRNFGFIGYDDDVYVYKNPHVLNGLSPDGISWAFTTSQASNWHPVTWLSLMLDCQLFGANAGRMHLVNLLLHIVNTLLLFIVLRKMTGSLWPSAFVAALFALHPMHVESVAWIAERKDVLSTFFWLLAMLAYVQYVKKPGVARYLLVLFIFALGLMAKPMLVTLPFVFLLLDYWPLERFGKRTIFYLIREKIPFFALSVISGVITFLVQRNTGAMADIDTLPLTSRIANAFLSYAQYIGKVFQPSNLAIFYPINAESIPFRQAASCALLLLGISFFVVYYGRNRRYLPVGWFWFVVTLIPVIGIVQVGSQAYADRYTYIPYIGLFIMLAWSLPQLLSKFPQRKIVLGASMIIVLTALGICAGRQVGYWNNSITLFSHAVEVVPNNWLAYDGLGSAYGSLDRIAEAIDAYKQAVRIKPDYADAYFNLGCDYDDLGRFAEAMDAYEQVIKIKPDYAGAYFGLGGDYERLGRTAEAIDAYKRAVKIKPDYAQAHYNLGNVYNALGRVDEAIEAFKQAIKIEPGFVQAHNNLGAAFGSLGRYQQEIDACQQAIKIKPDYVQAYNNLGAAFNSLGRYADAIEAYSQAVKIKPDYARAHDNLGYTYLMIGDKKSAIAEYNILKSLNSEMADKLLKEINK